MCHRLSPFVDCRTRTCPPLGLTIPSMGESLAQKYILWSFHPRQRLRIFDLTDITAAQLCQERREMSFYFWFRLEKLPNISVSVLMQVLLCVEIDERAGLLKQDPQSIWLPDSINPTAPDMPALLLGARLQSQTHTNRSQQ